MLRYHQNVYAECVCVSASVPVYCRHLFIPMSFFCCYVSIVFSLLFPCCRSDKFGWLVNENNGTTSDEKQLPNESQNHILI